LGEKSPQREKNNNKWEYYVTIFVISAKENPQILEN
jgi:hypothetical protein